MDNVDFTRFALAFVFVLGLIGLLSAILKRYGNAQKFFGMKDDGEHRIQVTDVRYLDPKRRLVLVRRDDTEHLILLADGRETVIESGIKAPMKESANG